jgi:hypothetical protein
LFGGFLGSTLLFFRHSNHAGHGIAFSSLTGIAGGLRKYNYGVMRAVGMSGRQLRKIITAEAAAYAITSCIAGGVLGLVLYRFFYGLLVTSNWGANWQPPLEVLAVIILAAVFIRSVQYGRRNLEPLLFPPAVFFQKPVQYPACLFPQFRFKVFVLFFPVQKPGRHLVIPRNLFYQRFREPPPLFRFRGRYKSRPLQPRDVVGVLVPSFLINVSAGAASA